MLMTFATISIEHAPPEHPSRIVVPNRCSQALTCYHTQPRAHELHGGHERKREQRDP